MNQNNSNIDKQLQEKFHNFAPVPPAFVWEEIDTKLNNQNKRKRGMAFWMVAASLTVAATVAAIFVGVTPKQDIPVKQELQNLTAGAEKAVENHFNIPQNKPLVEESRSNHGTKFGSLKVLNHKDQEKENFIIENMVNQLESSTAEASSTSESVGYGEFGSKTPQIHPFSIGNFLQLTLITPSSRKPLERKLSRWAFEVGYDQNQTAVTYKSNPEFAQYVHKNYLQRMKESEYALSASQVHFSLRYQLSSKWIVSAGLSWMQNRTQQNFHFRDSMPASVQQGYEADALGNYPIFGYLNLGPQINYDGISNVSMLSVPVGAIYEHSLNKKWTLTAEALIQANYLSAKKGNTLNYHTLMLQDIDGGVFRDLLWSGKFGFGLQRELSQKNSVGIRLNTQGMFTPMYKQNSAVENRGWSVGLSGYYVWRFIQ